MAAPGAINFDFAGVNLNFRACPGISPFAAGWSGDCFRRRKINSFLCAGHSIRAKNNGQNGRLLLDHSHHPDPILPSYCRAACCCILPNGRVDTSVIFACRCNTATIQSGSIPQSRTRRTRCSEASRVPISGMRCFNSAWQLVPSRSGLLVHTRLAGVLACWSTMPLGVGIVASSTDRR